MPSGWRIADAQGRTNDCKHACNPPRSFLYRPTTGTTGGCCPQAYIMYIIISIISSQPFLSDFVCVCVCVPVNPVVVNNTSSSSSTRRILLWDSAAYYVPPRREVLDHVCEMVWGVENSQRFPVMKMDLRRVQLPDSNDCALFMLQALEALYLNRHKIEWEGAGDITIYEHLSQERRSETVYGTYMHVHRQRLRTCVEAIRRDLPPTLIRHKNEYQPALTEVVGTLPEHRFVLAGAPATMTPLQSRATQPKPKVPLQK